MHYFKNEFGHVVGIENRLWPYVIKDNPRIIETNDHGVPMSEVREQEIIQSKVKAALIEIEKERKPLEKKPEVKPEIKEDDTEKKVTFFNRLEQLKEEKLDKDADTRVRRKRTAKK